MLVPVVNSKAQILHRGCLKPLQPPPDMYASDIAIIWATKAMPQH